MNNDTWMWRVNGSGKNNSLGHFRKNCLASDTTVRQGYRCVEVAVINHMVLQDNMIEYLCYG